MTSRRKPSRQGSRNEEFFSLPITGMVRPGRVWAAVFVVWTILLSGVLEEFTGSPGVVQAYRLSNLLESKRQALVRAEDGLIKLSQDRDALEESSAFQEREVRRVLGYVAPDELVFDFGGD